MRKLAYAVAGAAVAAFMAAPAWADSLPSSKAAVTFGDLEGLGAEACSVTGTGSCDAGGTTDDTGYITVMSTFIKTPNGKDLSFDVALQTGLITFTKSKTNGGGGNNKSNAEGRIVVRVKATPVDKEGIATGDPVRFALPDNDTDAVLGFDDGAEEHDGVTYDFRFQELEVNSDDLLCLEGGTITNDCEVAVSLLLETLQAHAFNFLLADVSSGIWKIEVQARALADSNVFGDAEDAKGEAFVGLGSTRVETLRLVKNFDPDDGPLFDIVDLQ